MRKEIVCRPIGSNEYIRYSLDPVDMERLLLKMIGHTIKDILVEAIYGDITCIEFILDDGQDICIMIECLDNNGVDISDWASLIVEPNNIGSVFFSEEEIVEKLGEDFLPSKE